jgi:hypothetical protein
VAPTTVLYLPASQFVQTVEAVAAAYLPETQFAQVEAKVAPTVSENLPATQMSQTVEAVAAAYVPAAQLSHAVAPVSVLYFPAEVQLVQVITIALQVPVKPLLVPEPSDVKVTLRKPAEDV